MAKEADKLPKIPITFVNNSGNDKIKTKPASQVQYSRKEQNFKSKPVEKPSIGKGIKLEENMLSKIVALLGGKRAEQFIRFKSLADQEGVINLSTKEIGEKLGIKKQATSNLCNSLLLAGLISIHKEFNSKTSSPRIFKVNN